MMDAKTLRKCGVPGCKPGDRCGCCDDGMTDLPAPPAAVIATADDANDEAYCCPHCQEIVTADDCDVLYADAGCLFCAKCGLEFRCG